MIDNVASSILSFHSVEYNTLTDVDIVRTSGQGKPAIFWFQLGTNFFGSKPIYFGWNALNSPN